MKRVCTFGRMPVIRTTGVGYCRKGKAIYEEENGLQD